MRNILSPILALCLLSAGCASADFLSEGGNSVIRYQQYEKDSGEMALELVLVQETHKDYENLYNEVRENANIKKCPLPKFSYLAESLVDLGFLDIAKAGRALPSEGSVMGTRVLVIESDAGRWVAENTDMSIEEKESLRDMVTLFRTCFNSILGLQVIHSGPGTGGEELFLEEQQKLKEQYKKEQNKTREKK